MALKPSTQATPEGFSAAAKAASSLDTSAPALISAILAAWPASIARIWNSP